MTVPKHKKQRIEVLKAYNVCQAKLEGLQEKSDEWRYMQASVAVERLKDIALELIRKPKDDNRAKRKVKESI